MLGSCKQQCLQQDLSFSTHVLARGDSGSEEEVGVLCCLKTVNLCSRLLEDPGLFSVVHPHSSCVDSPRSLMVRACVYMLAGPLHT